MTSEQPYETAAKPAHSHDATEVTAILVERGWIAADCGRSHAAETSMHEWFSRAAELLGPHAATREELGKLLELIFSYDAVAIIRRRESQEVLARSGAREVIREFANHLLDGDDLDSERFKQIIDQMKGAVPYRSRAMFHPIRLALTGRAGEGELDRVILLIDGAAKLNFEARVKSTRQRILEFCGALD